MCVCVEGLSRSCESFSFEKGPVRTAKKYGGEKPDEVAFAPCLCTAGGGVFFLELGF